ncbi:MBL fold metallo-hydrolase [Candidatus Giovannonibacteria bacterium]|nr:MBL fold metallo-hydrolase [Candidatus Giovannonibacteria bacterium]
MKKLTFDGKGEIGGSNYCYNGTIGVDHGAIQGKKKISYPAPNGVSPLVVIASHSHIDHIGGFACLAKHRPEAKFFMTQTTLDGMILLLNDSLKIARSQAEFNSLKGLPSEPPAFEEEDISHVESQTEIIKNIGWFEPVKGYHLSLRSAGHMRGASIELMVTPDGTRVVHAADISVEERALVRGAAVPKDFLNPDVLVIESTYGSKELPDLKGEKDKLISVTKETLKKGGSVLVGHFASMLDNIVIPLAEAKIQVYVDGMGRQFLRIYAAAKNWCPEDRPFSLSGYDNVHFIDPDRGTATAQRKKLLSGKLKGAIVCPSGMYEGGHSVTYIKQLMESRKNTIIMPGFQADETQGREIQEAESGDLIDFKCERVMKINEKKEAKEWHEYRRLNAPVVQIKYSGHSGGDKMAKWVAELNPKKVVTVHGDPEGHEGLKDRIHRLNRNIDVVRATGETIKFSFRS